MTPRTLAALSALLLALPLTPRPAAADTVFMSTQLRPIEEAQKMRDVILKDYTGKVTYVPEEPSALPVRIQAERQGGTHTISLIGALHGELAPLLALHGIVPLDDLAAKLQDRGIPAGLMTLGKLGTAHQMYIPWMQATYFMVANKQALPYLPKGADLDALTYEQLAAWGAAIQAKTGKRMLGFPAGPTGLMHRFIEGFLYPSYTGGLVTTFDGPAADAMWTRFAALWKESVNPELHQLQLHAATAAVGRCVDRLRPRRAAARRAAPEAGRLRNVPRPRRTEGARLHAGARRPRDRQRRPRCDGRGGADQLPDAARGADCHGARGRLLPGGEGATCRRTSIPA